MRMLKPATIRPPFAAYAHGVEVPPGARLVVTSGQLAARADDSVPEGALDQARLCLANCAAILAEAGMGPSDVIRINAFVTDRAHMAGLHAGARRMAAGRGAAARIDAGDRRGFHAARVSGRGRGYGGETGLKNGARAPAATHRRLDIDPAIRQNRARPGQ